MDSSWAAAFACYILTWAWTCDDIGGTAPKKQFLCLRKQREPVFFIAAHAGLYYVYLGEGGTRELAKFGMDGAVSLGMKLRGFLTLKYVKYGMPFSDLFT